MIIVVLEKEKSYEVLSCEQAEDQLSFLALGMAGR